LYKSLSKTSFYTEYNLNDKEVIALLPGSRIQEVKKILPVMLEASIDFKDYQFIIAASDNVPKEIYEEICSKYKVSVIFNKTYDILSISKIKLILFP